MKFPTSRSCGSASFTAEKKKKALNHILRVEELDLEERAVRSLLLCQPNVYETRAASQAPHSEESSAWFNALLLLF